VWLKYQQKIFATSMGVRGSNPYNTQPPFGTPLLIHYSARV